MLCFLIFVLAGDGGKPQRRADSQLRVCVRLLLANVPLMLCVSFALG